MPNSPAKPDSPENIRAEFFAWVKDQGCDTDGAWSAWQGAWERRSQIANSPAHTDAAENWPSVSDDEETLRTVIESSPNGGWAEYEALARLVTRAERTAASSHTSASNDGEKRDV